MLLPIHVLAGALAIILGAVALSVRKGGQLHRRSGMLFVYAMLVMGFSASLLGLRNGLSDPNVFVGFMTAYFVGTALTTVEQPSQWTRAFNAVALAVAILFALGSVTNGLALINKSGLDVGGEAMQHPRRVTKERLRFDELLERFSMLSLAPVSAAIASRK